ncbi:MAG: hypothetical protein ACOH2G_06325 [Ewingella sp.]
MSKEARVYAHLTDLVKLLKSIETPDGVSTSGSEFSGLANEIVHLVEQKFPVTPHLKPIVEFN